MSGKVTLNSYQAHKLESILRSHGKENVIRIRVDSQFGTPYEALNDIPKITLIRAIYEGYEVKNTASERFKYWYDIETSNGKEATERSKCALAVLECFGIKIDGINA